MGKRTAIAYLAPPDLPAAVSRAATACIRRCPWERQRLWRRYDRWVNRLGPIHMGRTYFGARIECDLRDIIQRMIFYFGVWEPDLSDMVESRLRPGRTFVDVGANIGYYSLLASRRLGTLGDVVAIEPAPGIFGMLTANLERNDARRVRAVRRAVSDRPGRLLLYPGPPGNLGRTTTTPDRAATAPAQEVDAAPLEQILTADERTRAGLIKVDVEGGEPAILRHLLDTLDLYPPDLEVLVELGDAGPEQPASALLFRDLRRAGFRIYALENRYDVGWYLDWRRPTPPVELQAYPAAQCDVLLTRDRLQARS